MTDNEKVKEFLSRQGYMVLAVVCDDSSPWAVPVKIQAHDDKGFEWDSKMSTEHSRAIEKNPAVSITIFEKLEDSQIGFYAKGTAKVVETKDNDFARYRIDVERAWINDETFVKREVNLTD